VIVVQLDVTGSPLPPQPKEAINFCWHPAVIDEHDVASSLAMPVHESVHTGFDTATLPVVEPARHEPQK
jgi:hypothetical protein